MLRGEKVILRAVEREDLKRMHELMQNVDLVLPAYGGWNPVPFAAYEKRFEKNLERDEQTYFVIEVDGKLIGEIFLHHLNRHHGTTQFGIGIYDPECVGKGYGRDALQTMLKWAFHIQGFRKLNLTVLAGNERAIRTYKACGFVEEGRMREEAFYKGAYDDVVMMGLLRADWEQTQK